LVSALARKLRNSDRKSNDFSSGFVVMSAVHHTTSATTTDAPFTHMVVMPLHKWVQAFSEPKAMSQLIELKTEAVMKEWRILNGSPESAGKRTQTERLFTLFDHHWKQWGKIAQRSECVLQLQTFGYTELYNKDPHPPPMRPYDVKVRNKPAAAAAVLPPSPNLPSCWRRPLFS
jgi:hypothetical protein